MVAKRGSELLLKRYNGSTYVTFGAMQSATLSINGNPIDVTTADDVDVNNEIWRSRITGVKELSVSGNGIAKAIEPAQSVYEDFALGNVVSYQVIVPYIGTFQLDMIVASMDFGGQYDGAADFRIELQSAGAPTFTPEV